MGKIFIVTSGEYSDYHIDGVFDNEELAQKFAEAFNDKSNYREMSVEDWELNPFAPQLKDGHKPFFVRMSKSGDSLDVHIEDSSYGFTRSEETGFDVQKNMYTHVFAKDGEHAVKIANERRTELIANNKWESK